MTYAIIILSVALFGVSFWAISLKHLLMIEKKDNSAWEYHYRGIEKESRELKEEIRILVDGGMIQQEKVEMKYRAIYKREKDMQDLALKHSRMSMRQQRVAEAEMQKLLRK